MTERTRGKECLRMIVVKSTTKVLIVTTMISIAHLSRSLFASPESKGIHASRALSENKGIHASRALPENKGIHTSRALSCHKQQRVHI